MKWSNIQTAHAAHALEPGLSVPLSRRTWYSWALRSVFHVDAGVLLSRASPDDPAARAEKGTMRAEIVGTNADDPRGLREQRKPLVAERDRAEEPSAKAPCME